MAPTVSPYGNDDRQPLRLPRGSVRALLCLILGFLFWALLLFSPESHRIPVRVYFLLALQMIFFISYGNTIAPKDAREPPPLWLPRGSIRTFIFLGFAATIGYVAYNNPDQIKQYLTPDMAELQKEWLNLVMAMAIGFMVGLFLSLGPWQSHPMFKDLQAWTAIIAMLAVGAEIIAVGLIQWTLPAGMVGIVGPWHYALVGIVSAYFGIRS